MCIKMMCEITVFIQVAFQYQMANFNNTKWLLLLYQPNNNTNGALFLVKLMALYQPFSNTLHPENLHYCQPENGQMWQHKFRVKQSKM